jgi:hypothetical protein
MKGNNLKKCVHIAIKIEVEQDDKMADKKHQSNRRKEKE